jgi:hypothetical protein
MIAVIGIVEGCGDIGVLSPFSARKTSCGSSYQINLDSANVSSFGEGKVGVYEIDNLTVLSNLMLQTYRVYNNGL